MLFTCQSSLGPSLGHCLRRPFSCEIPLRSGPRHCGQSCAGAVTDKPNKSAAVAVNDRRFIVCSLAQLRGSPFYWCVSETQTKRREFRRMSFEMVEPRGIEPLT